MAKIIYGGDTETVEGEPLTLQFYSEDVACSDLIFVTAKTAAREFIKWCNQRKQDCEHVIYIHNLAFDLPELFWGHHPKLVAEGGEFDFTIGKWHIKGVYGTPTFARMTDGHKRRILLVDSFSFYHGALASAAMLFCPDLPKLKRPQGLGEQRFTSRDTVFCEYAMRDPVITYHIGRALEKLHAEFDLQQCVSVADMAARIFRHRYLNYCIPQPSRDVVEAALLSYHGGKNNISAPAGWYRDVTSIDISSAYPHAMSQMPAFSNEKLYKRLRAKPGIKRVPDYGVYRVRGNVAQCKWPVVFSHAFKPLHGPIDVFIQGFEVNEALRSGELSDARIDGWFYDAERDPQAPALRAFCEEFYTRKESATDRVLRFMYKLILLAISGKFIQTRKTSRVSYVDIDSGEITSASELIAGGMFHPFIASATTAHTRARIHRIEHESKALHTATDGIFTQSTRIQTDKRKMLGALLREANGDLLMVRCKLYILYGDKKRNDFDIQSRVFKGKWIYKKALHGFQGTVFDLERLIATGQRKYTINKPNRLRESLKRGLVPNKFERHERTLKIGEIPLR